MFKTQLRAILRAELKRRGVAFADQVEVGIMVEVPAVAVTAHILARDADFFSLGTDDLIQYTLAIDRTTERVGYLCDPLHPAILRLVKHVIDSAHALSKWAAMCGEMAGELDAIPPLLGLGLDEFSVNGATVPQVKTLIRMLDFHAMQALAARALELATGAGIRALVREHIAKRVTADSRL
jgi:phosphotransferase system enzyme I (PtsI)